MMRALAIAALLLATPAQAETCVASWYGKESGPRTASGERFNENAMTCAHRTKPFGTVLHVTDLRTGREVLCVVNDRGPAKGFQPDRCVDLSHGAARKIGMDGLAKVRVE